MQNLDIMAVLKVFRHNRTSCNKLDVCLEQESLPPSLVESQDSSTSCAGRKRGVICHSTRRNLREVVLPNIAL